MLAKFYFNKGAFSKTKENQFEKPIKCFQLAGWQNVLTLNNLPKEYTKEFPIFYETITSNSSDNRYQQKGIMLLWYENGRLGSTILTKGSFLNEGEFKEFRSIVKEAGKRLTAILKNERQERKTRYSNNNSITITV